MQYIPSGINRPGQPVSKRYVIIKNTMRTRLNVQIRRGNPIECPNQECGQIKKYPSLEAGDYLVTCARCGTDFKLSSFIIFPIIANPTRHKPAKS